MFPQFSASWAAYFARACALRSKIRPKGNERLRILIRTTNDESFTALFLALCRSRVDLFFYNPNWGTTEEADAYRLINPHWVLGDFDGTEFVTKNNPKAPFYDVKYAGLRVMIPTGGSTGKVRFAIHDWSTLSASAYGFQAYFGCGTIRSLCVLPLYHVSGFMQLVRSILCLGQIVFARVDTFLEGCRVLYEDDDSDCFLSLVPTQLERLIKDDSNHAFLRKYHAIFVGGAPCSIGLLEDCRDLKLPLSPTYGMTETAAQVATLKPSEFLSGEMSVGRVLPHVRVAIVDDETGTELPAGEKGIVRITAGSVFKGYYAVEETPAPDLMLTSDIGCINERGCLQILGRRDRVVISGGEKIHLREVEIVFEQTGLVKDVAAFGLEDREWGTKLGIAYVPKEDFISEEAVKESVKGVLANFKEPKVYLRKTSLPRNEVGKLLLRDLVQAVK